MTAFDHVGILGGGQLGRMLAIAARPLGVSCLVFDPQPDACAGQVTRQLVAGYGDSHALRLFARSVQVVTYEFESVPLACAQALEHAVPLRPSARSLELAGDRLWEKQLFGELGLPTAGWARVDALEDLFRAGAELGYPLVLKTRRSGYDGKGQAPVAGPWAVVGAWEMLGGVPCIAERSVVFDRELSLLAVRSADGELAFYPLVENRHEAGILRLTLAPAPDVALGQQQRAEEYALCLLRSLDYVGVLALEFFERQGELLVNELAPRVHNSGHWTCEGAATSQFENHLRAITGRPLGSTAVTGCCAMVNLIGSVPRDEAVRELPETFLHLYGKRAAPGRKLGHVTVKADDPSELATRLGGLAPHLPHAVVGRNPGLADLLAVGTSGPSPPETSR